MTANTPATIDEVVGRVDVWQGLTVDVAPLSGGLTNENYLVDGRTDRSTSSASRAGRPSSSPSIGRTSTRTPGRLPRRAWARGSSSTWPIST